MAKTQSSLAEAKESMNELLSKVEPIPPPPLPPRALPRLHTLGMAPSGTTIDSRGHLQSYSGGVNNTITPIRPRPVLASASAFSFDSGLEVSPLTIKSFKFGESPPNVVSGVGVTFSNVKLATVSAGPCKRISFANDDEDDGALGEEEEEEGETEPNNSIEGYDKEVDAIHQRFFTPIPTISSSSVTTSTVSVGSAAHLDTAAGLANLAVQRRSNRVLRQQEINNNSSDHPNAYDSFYDVFDMEVGDDEVFLREDEQEQEQREMLAVRPNGPLLLPDVDADDEDVNQELFAQMPARGNGGADGEQVAVVQSACVCCSPKPNTDFIDRYALSIRPERCPNYREGNFAAVGNNGGGGGDGRPEEAECRGAAMQVLCPCCPPDPSIHVDFTDPNNRYALPIRPERCPNYRLRNNGSDIANPVNNPRHPIGHRPSPPIDIPRSPNSPSAAAAVGGDAVDSYSVPRPITHMPYYHPMAPNLLLNPPQQPAAAPEANAGNDNNAGANNNSNNNNAQPSSVRIIQPQHHRTDSNSSARSTTSSARRTPFGSHLRYETSDIATLNIVNSGCYSPPPVQQFNWFRMASGRSPADNNQHRLFMRFTTTTATLERRMQSMIPLDGSAGRLGRPYPIMRPLAGTTATFFFGDDFSDEDGK